MSNVLVINGNLHGHINPTFPLVKELVDRGEAVWYFAAEAFEARILSTGAHFLPSGEAMERFYTHYRPTGNHPLFSILEYAIKMDRELIPAVLKATEGMSFDYIIHDAMLGGGKFIGEKMGLPTVCSCSSFAMNSLPVPERMMAPGFHPQLDEFNTVLAATCKEWGIPVPSALDVFFKKGDLNLVYTSKAFHPNADSFNETFHFVGPSIGERDEITDFPLEQLDSSSKKVIYISLGTINTAFAGFYQQCMDALGDMEDCQVVMSVGAKTDPASFECIPSNFIVRRHVPQLEVLQRTDLFISHGGMNSVSEAFYYGVPVIAVPLANDQFMVAKQLASLGAGFALKMEDITVPVLRESVQKAVSDESFQEASRRIGESFREAGGYGAATDCIFEFKKSRGIR